MANLDDISIPTILKHTLEYLNDRMEHKGVVQHPTGFLELDYSLKGLRNGELIVIASRPAQGKSTLLMNMMLNNLDESETTRPIIIATGLTSATQYMLSFIAILAGIKQDSLKKGNLVDDDWPKLQKACNTAKDFPLYIDDSIRTISQLENLIDQVKEKHSKAPIVAIDDIAWLHLRDANFFARQSREIVSRLKRDCQKSQHTYCVFCQHQ